jgi:hypothetical protein
VQHCLVGSEMCIRDSCCLLSNGYTTCRTSTKPRKAIKTHHLVWYFTFREWPSAQIDHIDGSRFNNSICNLRLATKSQNMQNAGSTRKKPLPRGVNRAYKNRYNAYITANGKRIYLGYFKTPADAAQAYERASLSLHKDFSYYARQEVS